MKFDFLRKEKSVFTLLATLIFIFLLLRVLYIPLFFDELQTYNSYIRPGYWSPYNENSAANNHLINTWLSGLSCHAFGYSRFSLRLFSLLSFIPFAVFLFKTGGLIINKYVKWVFWLSLLFSINFISFWGLSRGYSFSFTFILICVYYTYLTFKKSKGSYVLLSVIFACLALLANLSLIIFALIIFTCLTLNILFKIRHYISLNKIIYLIFAISIGSWCLYEVLEIATFYKEDGQLWWGNTDGFFETTIMSLSTMLFNQNNQLTLYIAYCFCFLSLIMLIVFLVKDGFIRKYNSKNLFFFLFIGVVSGVIVLAALFDINYPYQRTGLYFYLLFIGAYFFIIDDIKHNIIRRIFILPFLILPIHFILNFNFSYVSYWEFANAPDKYVEIISELEKNSNNNSSIYIHGMGFRGWNMNIDKHNIKLPRANFDGTKALSKYDYIITDDKQIADFRDKYSLLHNEHTTNSLYKRKDKTTKNLIYDVSSKDLANTEKEYFEFIRTDIDSLGSSTIFFDVNIKLKTNLKIFNSKFIISITSKSSNKALAYKEYRLKFRDNWTFNDSFNVGHIEGGLPINEPLKIVVYIWNIEKSKYVVGDYNMKVYSVID